jgi:hypothetical protein
MYDSNMHGERIKILNAMSLHALYYVQVVNVIQEIHILGAL